MKKKMIEERIEMAIGKAYGYPDMANLEVNTDLARAIRQEIALLISDIVKEIVGEDMNKWKVGAGPNDPTNCYVAGYDRAKQEIRQRAKKLGIKI